MGQFSVKILAPEGQFSVAFNTITTFLRVCSLREALGGKTVWAERWALKRKTLERVGGLESLADEIADDARLGERVRQLGLSIALAPALTATTVAERDWRELLKHELRWGASSGRWWASNMRHQLFSLRFFGHCYPLYLRIVHTGQSLVFRLFGLGVGCLPN